MIRKTYIKNQRDPRHNEIWAQYLYDETNRMVMGTNGNNPSNNNANNGNPGNSGNNGNSGQAPSGGNNGSGLANNHQTVSKDFIIDYTAAIPRNLMEYENMRTAATMPNRHNAGLTYCYVYSFEAIGLL